jgi:ABC-type oligopeptide transport system substrate-binding subunit
MKFTKKLLIAFTFVFASLMLVACGDEVEDTTLTDTVSSLAVGYVSGDSATNVTSNVFLPTSIGDVLITWVSSNTVALSNAGVVTRPAVGQNDASVVLTATSTYDEESETKTFTLTVKALVLTDQQAVDAAILLVNAVPGSGDTVTSVTKDVVLPVAPEGMTLAWVSGSPSVISNAGVVTRPAEGLANAQVVLFATLTKGAASATKSFTFTVIAMPVLVTDQDFVDEAKLSLGIGFVASESETNVKSNLSLPTFDGQVIITWSSSNAAYVSNAGFVVRPEEGQADVTVTLTATLTKNAVVETKEFVLTVKAIPVNNYPVLQGVENLSIFVGQRFLPLAGVIATDVEDGELTDDVVVKVNTLNREAAGSYTIIYEVVDSLGRSTEATRIVNVVVPVFEGDFQPANYLSGVDLSKLPASEKAILFAAAESYLLENVYAGVPLYTRATRVMYSERVQLFSPEYNGVLGFGTAFSQLSEDDSNVLMYGTTYGNVGEYTWRASYNTDPTTLNPWIADDSATSDFIDMFTGGLYDFYFDETKTGYEILPSLALSEPIPVNPEIINGKIYAKVWQIPLRDNLQWKFHPSTDVSGLPVGYEDLDASDYLWTWEYALTNDWFRARTGGGDFVSQGIKGAADFLAGTATFSEVGLRMADGETNVLELEYLTSKSAFEIKYGFAGGVLSPINQELFEELGEDNYGAGPTSVASSGIYYFDTYTPGQLLLFKKNTNHPQSSLYFYTGYQFRFMDGSDTIFAEYLAGRLESAAVPASQVTAYANDPRVKTAPDATTWRLTINSFGTESARDSYIAYHPGVGLSENFVPEPILAYTEMRQALYYGFDRYYAAVELVKLYLPAHTLFASTYFLDGESGLSVRGTDVGQAVVDDFGGDDYAYVPDAAVALFKEAVAKGIADGHYEAGTATEYTTIQFILTYASSGNTSAQAMVANIEEQYEALLVDDVNFVDVDIVINDVAFPTNYYNFMMVANTDLGIGGISGSLLDAPSFLDVFSDDNRGGFTLSWGIDTSSVNIPVTYVNLDGVTVSEMWSYNALIEALVNKTYVKDGAEQFAWSNANDLIDAYLDMSGEVRDTVADGQELAEYVLGDSFENLAAALGVDELQAYIVVTDSGKNILFIIEKNGSQLSLNQQLGLDTTAESAIQNYIYANYGNHELVESVGPLTDAELVLNAYIDANYGYLTIAEVAADFGTPVEYTEVYATTWDPADPWEDAVVVLHIGEYYIGWAWL